MYMYYAVYIVCDVLCVMCHYLCVVHIFTYIYINTYRYVCILQDIIYVYILKTCIMYTIYYIVSTYCILYIHIIS